MPIHLCCFFILRANVMEKNNFQVIHGRKSDEDCGGQSGWSDPTHDFHRETAALVCVKPKVHVDVIKRTFRKLII